MIGAYVLYKVLRSIPYAYHILASISGLFLLTFCKFK